MTKSELLLVLILSYLGQSTKGSSKYAARAPPWPNTAFGKSKMTALLLGITPWPHLEDSTPFKHPAEHPYRTHRSPLEGIGHDKIRYDPLSWDTLWPMLNSHEAFSASKRPNRSPPCSLYDHRFIPEVLHMRSTTLRRSGGHFKRSTKRLHRSFTNGVHANAKQQGEYLQKVTERNI